MLTDFQNSFIMSLGVNLLLAPLHVGPGAVSKCLSKEVSDNIYEVPKPEWALSISRPDVIGGD